MIDELPKHAAYQCDGCDKPLTLLRAICVTSATEHLHADTAECVAKLEQRLGTYA